MRTFVTLALSALSLLAAEQASACSCLETEPADAFARAGAVLEGRVLSVEPADAGRVRVTMEVVQHWRGIEQERVVVETAESSAACGVAFEVGTSWLVYAERAGDAWQTGICARTRRIEDAGDDLAELGAGVVPIEIGPDDEVEEPAPRSRARGGCASCAVSAGHERASGVLGSLVAALAAWRVRRRRRAAQLL